LAFRVQRADLENSGSDYQVRYEREIGMGQKFVIEIHAQLK